MKTRYPSTANSIKKAIAIAICFTIGLTLYSQPTAKDYWFQTNDGFGKCPAVGEVGSYATWYRDNFDIKQLIHKRGSMYAYIGYTIPDPSHTTNYAKDPYNGCNMHADFNPAGCGARIYRHDAVENKWYNTTNVNMGSPYYTPDLMTNGTDLIIFANYGNIYIVDETQPDGHRLLTTLPLKRKDFWRLSRSADVNGVDWREIDTKEFIGDTVFFMIRSYEMNLADNKVKEQGIIKWNYKDGSITYDSIGAFPKQLMPTYVNNDASHFQNAMFVDHIAGRFTLFYAYRDAANVDSVWCGNAGDRDSNCKIAGVEYPAERGKGFIRGQHNAVRVLWTWDPIQHKWFNISEGPDWRNLTPSGFAGTLGLHMSWDKKNFFASLEQGIYQWFGDRWEYKVTGGSYNTGTVYPVVDEDDLLNTVKFYVRSRSNGIELIDYANRMVLGENSYDLTRCVFHNIRMLGTPDNGKTIYITWEGPVDSTFCDWSGCSSKEQGIYWLQPDPQKISSTVNLHLEAATYLGGSADENIPVGNGIGKDFMQFVGGNFAGTVQGTFKAGYFNTTANAATTSSKGKILCLNTFADTILGVLSLGNEVHDFDIQNFGTFKMVAVGDFGVSMIAPDGKTVLWTRALDEGSYNGAKRVDIDDNGNVAAFVSKSSKDFSKYYQDYQGNVLVKYFDNAGTQIGGNFDFGLSDMSDSIIGSNFYANDIAVLGDTVFITGFVQDVLPDGSTPVQSAYVRAYKVTSSGWTQVWQTIGREGSLLGSDQADTRGRVLNVGKDGHLYFACDAHGPDCVFRWDGKVTQTSQGSFPTAEQQRSIQFDQYNALSESAAQLGVYMIAYAQINLENGKFNKTQFVFPLITTGFNSMRATAIHADQKGFLYIGAVSAYQIANRDLVHINGRLLGDYAGDGFIQILSPDWKSRTFGGAFGKDACASAIMGIGIRDNIISASAASAKGTLFTGASRYDLVKEEVIFKPEWGMNKVPFRSADGINDAWLGVWYQDVWVHSQKDTLQPREYPSQPIMPKECFNNRVDFLANKTSVCLNEMVTITNFSLGDSCCHTWKFGNDATLLDGTTGKGPWALSWSTPGYKTITMSMIDSCNNFHFLDKYNYINVLQNITLDSISGPKEMCRGTKAIFKAKFIEDITNYEWTLPAGAVITKGWGTSTVEVIFAETGGDISVRGEYACGYTNLISKNVAVIVPAENKVMVVVNDPAALSTADLAIQTQLTFLGYTPWMRDDDEAQTEDHLCVALVVLSGTSNADVVSFKFRDVNTPVLVMNDRMLPKMGMSVDNEGVAFGTLSGTTVHITDNMNTLGQTLTTGIRPIYSGVGADVVQYAINCGSLSSSYLASDGVTYGPDAYFTGGSIRSTGATIANTTDQTLYRTSRRLQDRAYNFPVTNGFYEITLKYVNISDQSDYHNLSIEGIRRATALSVKSVIGNNTAYDRVYTTEVIDGQLNINFLRIANDEAEIAAIKVVKLLAPRINYSVANNAMVVSTIDGDPNKKTFFGYETGTKMYGTPSDSVVANARRVGLLMDRYGPQYWTASDGIPIFDRACCWATFKCPPMGFEINNLGTVFSPQCTKRSIDVSFTAISPNPTFGASNKYILEISNAYGDFTSSSVIGEMITNAKGNLVISGQIPASMLPGTKYKVRIKSTDPAVISIVTSNEFTIMGTPPKPEAISGPTIVCKYTPAQTYTVPAIPGMKYLWEIPLGTQFVTPSAPNQSFLISLG